MLQPDMPHMTIYYGTEKNVFCRQEKCGQNTDTLITFNVIIVKISTKYFVPHQQFKGEPLLHFYADTVHFYIVDSYIYINNNKQDKQCSYDVTMRRVLATVVAVEKQ